MAITIKRCMCGCSLRTGLSIWLWISTILVVPLIISEADYLVNGSNYPFLYCFHIFQFSSAIGWAIVNIVSLLAIYKKNPKLLVPFLWFSVLSILSFIIILILFAIFWRDIMDSEITGAYIQELIIVEEARQNPADKGQLYEKIKEIITHFGLPVIVGVGALFLVLEIYVTIASYSLYNIMNEPQPQPVKIEVLDQIVTVETKKRRSLLLAHSIREVKPLMKIN